VLLPSSFSPSTLNNKGIKSEKIVSEAQKKRNKNAKWGKFFHKTHPSEVKKCFNCLKCHCHSSPTLNFSFFHEGENDTEIIWRMKNPPEKAATTYHAIFHIIIIRKKRKIFDKKERR
jgi:hypothetical protein